MRLRLTIANMMTLVVASAWASALTIFSLRLQPTPVCVLVGGCLVVTLIAAALRRGWIRSFGIGFVLFGSAIFIPSLWIPNSFPTIRILPGIYDKLIGSPTMFKPEDVVPFVLQLIDFLRVGNAILALIAGLIGGTICLGLSTLYRRIRVSLLMQKSRKAPLPPQVAAGSIES